MIAFKVLTMKDFKPKNEIGMLIFQDEKSEVCIY
jgi:hypothetical protein